MQEMRKFGTLVVPLDRIEWVELAARTDDGDRDCVEIKMAGEEQTWKIEGDGAREALQFFSGVFFQGSAQPS